MESLAKQVVKDLQTEGFAVPDDHIATVALALAPPVAATPVATGLRRGPKKGTVSAFAYFRDTIALPEWYKIKEVDKTANYKVWAEEHISARWNQIKSNPTELAKIQGLAGELTQKNQTQITA